MSADKQKRDTMFQVRCIFSARGLLYGQNSFMLKTHNIMTFGLTRPFLFALASIIAGKVHFDGVILFKQIQLAKLN